jgi:hypothetical protein
VKKRAQKREEAGKKGPREREKEKLKKLIEGCFGVVLI